MQAATSFEPKAGPKREHWEESGFVWLSDDLGTWLLAACCATASTRGEDLKEIMAFVFDVFSWKTPNEMTFTHFDSKSSGMI